MKIVVTGGRTYNDAEQVASALSRYSISILAQGGAKGADRLALMWANAQGIPTLTYHADWQALGKSAGMRRNIEMLEDFQPDLVIAFPGGGGTAGCVREAKKRNIPVVLITEKQP